MKSLIAYFKKLGGYATMKELKKASYYSRDISNLLKEGVIEKIKPGLYRLSELPVKVTFRESLVDVCHAVPECVICLTSAFEYHDLTTFNPSEVSIAIPHANRAPRIMNPPVKTYYFRSRFFALGIETYKAKAGIIRVYNKEKTICDMFRYRNKLGEDLAIEGLKNYLRSKDANLKVLQEYAIKCQVKTILIPYLRALVG
jgi:predicted transcriptional regulator of viral defense system